MAISCYHTKPATSVRQLREKENICHCYTFWIVMNPIIFIISVRKATKSPFWVRHRWLMDWVRGSHPRDQGSYQDWNKLFNCSLIISLSLFGWGKKITTKRFVRFGKRDFGLNIPIHKVYLVLQRITSLICIFRRSFPHEFQSCDKNTISQLQW